jgi:uncharacterized repeat protein (TIGR03803 family)
MKKALLLCAVLAAANLEHPGQAQSYNVIYTFPDPAAGFDPVGVPYIAPNGVIYGATFVGGEVACVPKFTNGCGTVFSLTPPISPGADWTKAVLYAFHGTPADGISPTAGVMPGANGTLLGTTGMGGPQSQFPLCDFGCGTFFQLAPSAPGKPWTEQILYCFTRMDANPGALLAGGNDVFYGPSFVGGNDACTIGCGTIYELLPPGAAGDAWSLTSIHQFVPNTGQNPLGSLAQDSNGVIYGTTLTGGELPVCRGCGTAFSLTPPVPPSTAWTFHLLYRFRGGTDGDGPYSGLILGLDGTLYGTTIYGGVACSIRSSGCGTVFSLTPPTSAGQPWTKTTLYSFVGGSDGGLPQSGVTIGPGGVLYGTTPSGGAGLCER